jgi:hypothetical protein
MRLANHARFVEDQGVGQGTGVLGEIDAGKKLSLLSIHS